MEHAERVTDVRTSLQTEGVLLPNQNEVAVMRTGGPSQEQRAAWAREQRALLKAGEELPPTVPYDGEYGEWGNDEVYLSDPEGDEPMEEEEEGDDLGEPDLRSYFAQWGLAPGDQIALCRTYANHLSAALRPATRGPYKKKRTAEDAEDVPDAPVKPRKSRSTWNAPRRTNSGWVKRTK